MNGLRIWALVLAGMTCVELAQGDDLHFKKTISVGGNAVSSSEIWVKGARERAVTSSPAGNTITLRQCDLKRTVTVNEQSQSYAIADDARGEAAIKAAALMGGAPAAPAGQTITLSTTITDTGERKQLLGYAARHLKTTVQVESPASSCSLASQKYEIDGWYTDVTKEQGLCLAFLPPVRQADGCNDPIVEKRTGTAKSGYPLAETITLHNADASTTKIDVATAALPKQVLPKDQFDPPASFRQVKTLAELNHALQVVQPAAEYAAAAALASTSSSPNSSASPSAGSFPSAGSTVASMGSSQLMNMGAGGVAKKAGMFAQLTHGGLPGMASQLAGGMPNQGGMPNPGGASAPVPQALGPKAPGKIRLGVAPAQAQMGQGNDAQADYGTPIRNSIVLMMSGPAVEIAAPPERVFRAITTDDVVHWWGSPELYQTTQWVGVEQRQTERGQCGVPRETQRGQNMASKRDVGCAVGRIRRRAPRKQQVLEPGLVKLPERFIIRFKLRKIPAEIGIMGGESAVYQAVETGFVRAGGFRERAL